MAETETVPTPAPIKRLDMTQQQSVSYCIPTWLRDEQIRLNIKTVLGRIQPCHDLRQDPIAVVGFGPSLRDTWERIREFKWIITCSGSHKFLIERGIIPTWHVEVDPRNHKIGLLGEPNPKVTYLPASCVHPEYLAHLRKVGAEPLLWHVFDNTEEAERVLPRGEWAITGGCDVGLRAMTIARFFGFRDLHCFGIDGSAIGPGEGRHAGDHPYGKQKFAAVDYEGRTFYTTPAMLEAAKGVWHELNMMPDVTATFHGDGLIQHMAKFYKPDPRPAQIIAAVRPSLISTDFRTLNTRLHQENLLYGVGGGKHAPIVTKLVESLKKSLNQSQVSVLDYGCGKGYLAKALPFPIWEYDPAIPEKAELPRPADLVVCTDVLEHIEPDRLVPVLDDLRRCVKHLGYFTIHTGPAAKHYADGRNTHLIQQGFEWWKARLKKFFLIGKMVPQGPEIIVVVAPLAKPRKTMIETQV